VWVLVLGVSLPQGRSGGLFFLPSLSSFLASENVHFATTLVLFYDKNQAKVVRRIEG